MCQVQRENCECRALAQLAAAFQGAYTRNPSIKEDYETFQEEATADIESVQGKGKLACQRQIAIGNLGAGYLQAIARNPSLEADLHCLYDSGVEYLENEKEVCNIIKTGEVGEALMIAVAVNSGLLGNLITQANQSISGTDSSPFQACPP